MENLGTLGGGDSLARSVSADGETVVGYSVTTAGDEHAFVWTVAGGMGDLGTLGGRNSYTYGVSDNGKRSWDKVKTPTANITRPVGLPTPSLRTTANRLAACLQGQAR